MGTNLICAFENNSFLSYFKIEETTKNLNQVDWPWDLNQDLPNVSLVRYHRATSLGGQNHCLSLFPINSMLL